MFMWRSLMVVNFNFYGVERISKPVYFSKAGQCIAQRCFQLKRGNFTGDVQYILLVYGVSRH